MKRKHGYIPSALDQLESRVVLSQTTQALSVVVSGLSPHLRVLNRKQQAFSAEISQAFSSFQADYDQARQLTSRRSQTRQTRARPRPTPSNSTRASVSHYLLSS